MYGIKGYVFIGDKGKIDVKNSPFEALTDYEKGHEYMNEQINLINMILSEQTEPAYAATGYMFLLVPEEEWKEEE